MSQVVPSTQTAEQIFLDPQDELRMFRNVMRSLTSDAAKALNELEMWCNDTEQLQRCGLLHHYLDYMKRLCEKKV